MKLTLTLITCGVLMSACTQAPNTTRTPTRSVDSLLSFQEGSVSNRSVSAQVAALNASADRLVLASTAKGAMIGAAVGCGLSVLSASNASKCLGAAAIGAAGGAFVGHRQGKKTVQRRIEIANPNALVRNLRAANKQLDQVQLDLPTLLAQQESAIEDLSMQLAAGKISQMDHDQRLDRIRKDRADLAQALSLSAQQARNAHQNLQLAAQQGHSGLDWHIAATAQLERETTSARSSISLL